MERVAAFGLGTQPHVVVDAGEASYDTGHGLGPPIESRGLELRMDSSNVHHGGAALPLEAHSKGERDGLAIV